MRPAPAVQPRDVAIYIRWSTDEQTEGTTLETQRERCTLYVRSQGWEVNDDLIFIDEGCSGGSLDRPALTRLRKLVQDGLVDGVVTYSLDRLSRNLADMVQLVRDEWLGRCILRTASQPIGTDEDSPTGQLIFNILASFAEFERGLIRERTYSGTVRRAREGKYPGGRTAPYGYRRTGKGVLTIDSVEPDGTLQGPAAAVRRMFELAADGPLGMGPARIARTIEAEGWPSPGGGPWWTDTVRWILRHPVYVGDVTFGRTRINPAARRNKTVPQRWKAQDPLVHVPEACPAIVPRDLWEQVQQLLQQRQHTYTPRTIQARNRSLLASIARCKCGGPMSIFIKAKRRRYYRCTRNFMTAGSCGCSPGLIDADFLEQVVEHEIKIRYGTPELKAAALAEAADAARIQGQVESIQTAIHTIEQRLKGVDEDLARLRRAARKGEIELGTYEDLRKDAIAEQGELTARRAELESNVTRVKDSGLAIAALGVTLERIDAWDDLDTVTKREVLSGLLRELLVYRRRGSDDPPEIEFRWEMSGPGGQVSVAPGVAPAGRVRDR